MLQEIGRTSLVVLAMLAIFLLITQIISYKNVKKQKKHFTDLHQALKPGKEVMLTGGIYGKIKSVKEHYVMLEISKDVIIKVSRYSISEIIE